VETSVTVIYCESTSPDTLVVETTAEGKRVVIRLAREAVAASLGGASPTFRALSDAVASRIDEITSTHGRFTESGSGRPT
jgi:hypothetical protein